MTKRPRPSGARTGENPRPPRYRLLAAAAALPQRKAVEPTQRFDADCPTCGRIVVFTQLHGDAGIDYAIEQHDCFEG